MTGGGALTQDIFLQLRGDVAQPGGLRYYGTDTAGAPGWHPLPANIANLLLLEQRVKTLETQLGVLTTRVGVVESLAASNTSRIAALEAAAAQDGVVWHITAVNYAVAAGVNHVKVTTALVVITLPSAASVRSVIVKNGTSGTVSIMSVSLIDGFGSVFLAGFEAAKCVADGTTWNIA